MMISLEHDFFSINLNQGQLRILEENKDFRIFIDLEKQGFTTIFFTESKKNLVTNILEIAQEISKLPSDELKAFAYTPDLEQKWEDERWLNGKIAKYFIFFLLCNDWETAAKLTISIENRYTKNLCIQMARRYRALWEVLIETYSIAKSREIFCEIAKEERNKIFEIPATVDYIQFLTDQASKTWAELQERIEFNPFGSPRLEKLMTELSEKAKKNSSIRGRWRVYLVESLTLMDVCSEILSARTSQGKIATSEEWHNGHRARFDKSNKPTNRYKS
jgi:hypothetical protein